MVRFYFQASAGIAFFATTFISVLFPINFPTQWTSDALLSKSGHSPHCITKIENAWGTQWRSWLRHCATSRKVPGSIFDGVIGIFHWRNPSGHTMTLGSTQPLTEMSIRHISWGVEAASADGLPYHLNVPNVLKSESLNLLEPSGPVQACNGIALFFNFYRLHGDLLPATRTSCLVHFQFDISTSKILLHENIFRYHSKVCNFKNANKLVLPVTTSNSYNLRKSYTDLDNF